MIEVINQSKKYRMKSIFSCGTFFSMGKLVLKYLCLTLIFFNTNIFAQTAGKLTGEVLDAQTGEPLIGANVVILGTSMGAATDIDGNFFILNVPAGKYDIQVSMIGYEKTVQRGVIVNSGRTTHADFKLKATAFEQDAVIVEATRPEVEPEKTSTSAIIRPEDVQQMAGIRTVADVLGLAADITDGHFRGGRQGEELYTLQGMGIVNPLDNTTGLLPIMSAVEEVEVITSGFGAQYGNAQSGVVNITMKEGKSDKWRSHIEVNMRLPGRKYFGGNVYDLNSNKYLQTLLSETSWKAPTGDDPGFGYWTAMGISLRDRFGRDTVVQMAVARALWAQSRRSINDASYDKKIDYSQEISAGGPINEEMRMFFALRNNVSWPNMPVEHPDMERQVMGNIVSDIAKNATIRFSGAFSLRNRSVFPGMNSATSPGYFRWVWDNLLSIQNQINNNTQFGVRFTQALDKRTFYEIKINSLLTTTKRGSSPYPLYIPDSLLGTIDWSKRIAQPVGSSPDGFSAGYGVDDFIDNRTNTYSLDASISSQVTNAHLINAGLQAVFYKIEVNNRQNTGALIPQYNQYVSKPREYALYVQDKMEFQGMIANIGLRLDIWDQNVKYNPNIYAPFRQYDTTLKKDIYTKEALSKQSPIVGRLQPRVGISFPVSEFTVFHLNYGSFMQRPAFQYILNSQVYPATYTGNPLKADVLGNPTLRPQITYSYDVGVVQALTEGFTLDASGYYKDVKDLIQAATFADSNRTNSYTSYINRAYADIRGFRIVLSKKRGSLTGSINYQYSVATGKSSAVGSMMPSFSENNPADLSNTSLKDILLDFDRTHNLLINLNYVTEGNWGFKLGNFYPLGDVSLSVFSTIRSGRPYSYYNEIHIVEVNNKRSPMEYNTNFKMAKRIKNFFGVATTVYLEVFNLFNNKILNYEYLFESNTSGQINPNTTTYLTIPIDSPSGSRYQNDRRPNEPQLGVDKSFLIYSNQPTSINVGITIDF